RRSRRLHRQGRRLPGRQRLQLHPSRGRLEQARSPTAGGSRSLHDRSGSPGQDHARRRPAGRSPHLLHDRLPRGLLAGVARVGGAPPVASPHPDERLRALEGTPPAGIREADPVPADPAQTARAGIGVFEPTSLEGTSGAPTGFGNTPVTDPKVVWSFHVYCGNFAEPVPGTRTCADLTGPAFDGTAGIGGSIRNAAHLTGADSTVLGAPRVPGAQPAPQLMSEFGSSPDPDVTDDTLVHADPLFI